MAIASDPEHYRRRQRRRALIGWIGGLGAVIALILVIVLAGSGSHEPRPFSVPYGETMTAKQYAEIDEGEEAADVLEGLLDASGRPERFTKGYVLALFPPREDGDACTYWEFSDQPRIFARLCFSESTGELVQKLKNSVLPPLTGGQGQVVWLLLPPPSTRAPTPALDSRRWTSLSPSPRRSSSRSAPSSSNVPGSKPRSTAAAPAC